MVEGFVLKYNRGEGFFCKRVRKVEGLLIELGKREGALGIFALLFFLPTGKQGRGA